MAEKITPKQELKHLSLKERVKRLPTFFEYLKVKNEMKKQLAKVSQARKAKTTENPQAHLIKEEQYSQRVYLHRPLSQENTVEMYDQLASQLKGSSVRIEDKGAWKSQYITPGWLDTDVLFPIVPLPQIEFNKQKLSQKQRDALEKQWIKILDAASVSIHIRTRFLTPEEQLKKLGENFEILIQPKEKFINQLKAAESLSAAITQTDVIRQRLTPAV